MLDETTRLLDEVNPVDELNPLEEVTALDDRSKPDEDTVLDAGSDDEGVMDVPAALVPCEVAWEPETTREELEPKLVARETALELMPADDPMADDARKELLDPCPCDDDMATPLLLLSGSTPLDDPLAARWQVPSTHSQPCGQSCASMQP